MISMSPNPSKGFEPVGDLYAQCYNPARGTYIRVETDLCRQAWV